MSKLISMENLKKLLFAFVFIAIGFSLGKHHAVKVSTVANSEQVEVAQSLPTQKAPVDFSQKQKLMVFYCHSTFRCETCNQIEKMARQLVETKYSEQLKTGRMQWEEFNFQKDSKLSSAFDVSSSCVIVALTDKTGYVQYKRLELVWQLLDKPDEFNSYLVQNIDEFLKKQENI